MCRYAQKLSGRAKTFRSAMPTRRRGFSASGSQFLCPLPPLYSALDFKQLFCIILHFYSTTLSLVSNFPNGSNCYWGFSQLFPFFEGVLYTGRSLPSPLKRTFLFLTSTAHFFLNSFQGAAMAEAKHKQLCHFSTTWCRK